MRRRPREGQRLIHRSSSSLSQRAVTFAIPRHQRGKRRWGAEHAKASIFQPHRGFLWGSRGDDDKGGSGKSSGGDKKDEDGNQEEDDEGKNDNAGGDNSDETVVDIISGGSSSDGVESGGYGDDNDSDRGRICDTAIETDAARTLTATNIPLSHTHTHTQLSCFPA